jgi:hypothetical protein
LRDALDGCDPSDFSTKWSPSDTDLPMRQTSYRGVVGCGLVLAGAAGGCGRNTAPPQTAESERTALVAQPCPGLELGSDPLDPAKARLFVEIAEVNTRELPQPIGRWLDENAVKVRSTVNLVAFPGVPTSMPWGQCVDAVCSSMKLSITVTARLPERASDPIELAVSITDSVPEGPEPLVLLDTALRAVNQEPVVLPPAPRISDGSVIVTAYLLRRSDDLHRLLECKVRQGEKEKAIQ